MGFDINPVAKLIAETKVTPLNPGLLDNYLNKFNIDLNKLKNNERLLMVTGHIITPTFVDDIAGALDILINQNHKGIFHIVGSQFISPYDVACLIAKIYGFDTSLIEKTTREKFFKDRAPRPFNLSLKNDKIQKLGAKMRDFGGGLIKLKKQMEIVI